MARIYLDYVVDIPGFRRDCERAGAAAAEAYLAAIEAAAADVDTFLRDVKLNRPGPAYGEPGYEPAPAPGGLDEPILHRKTGTLADAAGAWIDPADRRNFIRAVRRLARGETQFTRDRLLVINVGFPDQAPEYWAAHEFGYAANNLPRRPYLEPTAERLRGQLYGY